MKSGGCMNVILFGCGKYYKKYSQYLKNYNVIAIADNNAAEIKSSTTMIIYPEEILNYEYDEIFIMSIYVDDIIEQLLSIGIPREKIYTWVDFKELEENPTIQFEIPKSYKKRVALISHDLSHSGAPLCIYNMAKILKKRGCFVGIFSPFEGEAHSEFKEVSDIVIVDRNLQVGCIEERKYFKNFDLVVVNTAILYYLLRKKNIGVPIIWWLHEPVLHYTSIVKDEFGKISSENMKVYAVSSVAEHAFRKYNKICEVRRLTYGMDDVWLENNASSVELFTKFVIIGELSHIKGQDILVDALCCLNTKKDISNCKFCFIGNYNSKFGNDIIVKLDESKINYELLGTLEHDNVLCEIAKADSLICSSRVECMSVSINEALMLKKPVIISDTTGNAEFIKDGKNGFLFEAGDSESLACSIERFLECEERWSEIGNEGRKIFDTYFSIADFERKVRTISEV